LECNNGKDSLAMRNQNVGESIIKLRNQHVRKE